MEITWGGVVGSLVGKNGNVNGHSTMVTRSVCDLERKVATTAVWTGVLMLEGAKKYYYHQASSTESSYHQAAPVGSVVMLSTILRALP